MKAILKINIFLNCLLIFNSMQGINQYFWRSFGLGISLGSGILAFKMAKEAKSSFAQIHNGTLQEKNLSNLCKKTTYLGKTSLLASLSTGFGACSLVTGSLSCMPIGKSAHVIAITMMSSVLLSKGHDLNLLNFFYLMAKIRIGLIQNRSEG